MWLPRTRYGIGTVHALLGLIVVVPVWFIASIAEGIASLRPRRLRSQRLLLFSFLVLWATGWTVAAIVFPIGPVLILGFVYPVWLLAILGPNGLSSEDSRDDDILAQTFPQTTWRLCDPNLLTSGVWRAEIESHPIGIDDGTADRELVEWYVRSLIRDWSYRSGWPFLGCRVRQISGWSPALIGGSPHGAEWCAEYRVTLDVIQGPQRATLRLGIGFAEFQLDRRPSALMTHAHVGGWKNVITGESPEAEEAESVDALPPMQSIAGPHHPLWDRWLDP